MPYIPKLERKILDPVLNKLRLDNPGQLAYALTMLCRQFVEQNGVNYFYYALADGVLGTVQKEFYRRWVAPYEDAKREANGDL